MINKKLCYIIFKGKSYFKLKSCLRKKWPLQPLHKCLLRLRNKRIEYKINQKFVFVIDVGHAKKVFFVDYKFDVG